MKRLIEHLQCYGTNDLSTAELLAFTLSNRNEQNKILELAYRLLTIHGVRWFRNASVDELHRTAGLTLVQAARLKAICELVGRFALLEPEARTQIKTADDAAALLRPLMAHLDHEEFRVLVLDTRNRVVANTILYTGSVSEVPLRAAEVFRPAIVRNCPKIIIAHNHPGTDPDPSPDDLDVTRQLV